jgi:DNA-binding TFAR19-related protein (PDSD5 family)
MLGYDYREVIHIYGKGTIRGGIFTMNLSELLKKYKVTKNNDKIDYEELLTLAKRFYISNEISFQDYKSLVKNIEQNSKQDTYIPIN